MIGASRAAAVALPCCTRSLASARHLPAPGGWLMPNCPVDAFRRYTSTSSDDYDMAVCSAVQMIQEQLGTAAHERLSRLNQLKERHGSIPIGNITLRSVVGGMRGMTALLTETSVLDAETGLKIHGVPMRELLLEHLPKWAPEHTYPSVESFIWFLLTSQIPTEDQVRSIQRALFVLSLTGSADVSQLNETPLSVSGFIRKEFLEMPRVIKELIHLLPRQGHPMTKLAVSAAALSDFSFFRASLERNIFKKRDIWKPAVFDALSLISKIAVAAAHIYRRSYSDGIVAAPDRRLDFAANFSRMMGFESDRHHDLFRLYLLLHADHEGGNVSAHAAHLVGSALADPFASYAAGIEGLGGPLHGLANQKCLGWLRESFKKLNGAKPTKERVREIAEDTLNSGNVIPGFGHAVLRITDPRFTLQREFALENIADDELFRFLDVVQTVVPEVLAGKVSNPYPNVDCHSGVILQAMGIREEKFYTVLFGVSRAIGIGSQYAWARALGMPIERPKSITLNDLEQLCEKKNIS